MSRGILQRHPDQRFHLKYTYNNEGIDFHIERISSNDKVGQYIKVKYGAKGLSEEQLQQEFGNVLVKSDGEFVQYQTPTAFLL